MFREVEQEILEITKDRKTIKLILDPIPNILPNVSIVLPVFNRSEFIDLIIRNWGAIDYPKENLELLVVDDSTNKKDSNTFKIKLEELNDPRITYVKLPKHVKLGEKRNICVSLAKYDYIVHFDSDDFFPSGSVMARIRCLLKYPGCLIGCSVVNCYDLISGNSFESFDPDEKGEPRTISESTMAYHKQFWLDQKFDENDESAECLKFLKDREHLVRTIPSSFIVTQLSHNNNVIQRRVANVMGAYNFLDGLVVRDLNLINELKARVLYEIPEWRKAIEFVKKLQNLQNNKDVAKMFENVRDEDLLKNELVLNYRFENLTTKNLEDIVYYCGPGNILRFSNKWSPDSKNGGSEEMVVRLSEIFVKRGHKVKVYCCLDGKARVINGVEYYPYWDFIPRNTRNVLIIWRDYSVYSNIRHLLGGTKKIMLDIHDALVMANFEYDDNCFIMVKSKFHKELVKCCKNVKVIPNGIEPIKIVEKKKNMIVATSSPDRCLLGLLKALPIIRKEIPEIQIHYAYGFSNGVNGSLETSEDIVVRKWVSEMKELMRSTEGFYDHDRLSQEDVVKLYQEASFYVYGTYFDEIDCLSFSKALSAGCVPIIASNNCALAEKMKYLGLSYIKLREHDMNPKEFPDFSLRSGLEFDLWVNKIIEEIKNYNGINETIVNKMNSKYNLKNVANEWLNCF